MSWLGRYWTIASRHGQRISFSAQDWWRAWAATKCKRKPVSAVTFEQFSRVGEIRRAMRQVRREYRLRSILLVDVGKNVLAYQLAAQACGLRHCRHRGQSTRGTAFGGVRIVDDTTARRMAFDGVIIANSSPAHAGKRAAKWRAMDVRPVIDLLVSAGGMARTIAA